MENNGNDLKAAKIETQYISKDIYYIKPEDCTLIEPPKILNGILEIKQFIELLPPQSKLIQLPYLWKYAELHSKSTLVPLLMKEMTGKDTYNNDKSMYPVAISLITINGHQHYAINISESPSIPVPGLERKFYRENGLDSIQSIKSEGFFNTPGRFCFRGSAQQCTTTTELTSKVISLTSNSKYFITDDPEGLAGIAIGFNHPNLGAKLPENLKSNVELYDVSQGQTYPYNFRRQEKQILSWAEIAGMLVKIEGESLEEVHI